MTISEMVKLFLWRQKKTLIKSFLALESDRAKKESDRAKTLESDKAKKWVNKNSITFDEYFGNIDAALWEEVVAECNKLNRYSKGIQSSLPAKMATGDMKVLHFLVRKFKPKIVVETGVATGCSTLSILRAFQKNGFGRLYSSDLPHKNWSPKILNDPEQYIGIVAHNEPNRDCWNLDIRGDRLALPEIVKKIGDNKIDLFHFDSDKSRAGRQFCMDTLMNKFHDETILVFDDIADNFHFRDFVQNYKLEYVVISQQKNSYTGKGIVPKFGRKRHGA